jgi:hypothetical protein
MSECVLIAIVGALINMVLALVIPCLLKNTQQPILANIKKVYATHKQVIFTSSVIVFVTIYLALKLSPQLGFSFDNEISLNPMNDFDDIMPTMSRMSLPQPRGEMDNLLNSFSNKNGFKIINLSKL